MKSLSKTATKTFQKLIAGITEYGEGRKVDNSNGTYMPVSVHLLTQTPLGKVYSVTHYFEQNGDLMSDPDMTFLLADLNGEVYPMTYRQDSLGMYQVAVQFDNGKTLVRPKLQKDLATFANRWMGSIKRQQSL